jgi:hypothetical protein
VSQIKGLIGLFLLFSLLVALCYGLKRRDARREAILKARRATGAKDNTAAAAAEEEKTQEDAGDTVLFVDMGHSYLNVLVASYGRSKLTVRSPLLVSEANFSAYSEFLRLKPLVTIFRL